MMKTLANDCQKSLTSQFRAVNSQNATAGRAPRRTRRARQMTGPPHTGARSGVLRTLAHGALQGEGLAAHELEVGVRELHHQLAAIVSVTLAHVAL